MEKLVEISMRPGHVLKIYILLNAELDHWSHLGISRTLNRTFGPILKKSGSDIGSGQDFACPIPDGAPKTFASCLTYGQLSLCSS